MNAPIAVATIVGEHIKVELRGVQIPEAMIPLLNSTITKVVYETLRFGKPKQVTIFALAVLVGTDASEATIHAVRMAAHSFLEASGKINTNQETK